VHFLNLFNLARALARIKQLVYGGG